jgi:predicted nucleic acid-binding Zn ribbon protein
MQLCERCGKESPDEAAKCSSCGYSFSKDRKLGNLLIILLATVMVIATIIAFVFLL